MPQIANPTLSFNTETRILTVTDVTVYGSPNYVRSNYDLILVKESISNDIINSVEIITEPLNTISSWEVSIARDGVYGISIVAALTGGSEYDTSDPTLVGSTNILITSAINESINNRYLQKAKTNCYDNETYYDRAYLHAINDFYNNGDIKKAQDLIDEYYNNIINY